MANTDNVISALKKYFFSGAEYVIPVGLGDDEIQAMSNYIESQGKEILLVDSEDISKLAPLSYNERTAGFSVPVSDDGENQDVLSSAYVGRVAGLTVGTFDGANLTGLVGVQPQDQLSFQQNQLTPYEQANVNTYYYAQGTPILRDGKTLTGDYIDQFLGLDWIVRHSLKELTAVMTKNDKLSFDANGINVLATALQSVFATAYGQEIIDSDSNGKTTAVITALPRDDMKDVDIKARKYKGLSWKYEPAASIDDGYITGVIDL